MKKLLVIAILCTVLLLSACAKTEIRPAQTPEETAAAAAEPVIISFMTTDMDGNEVDSADLFAAHEYTMVNVWTSWCVYCVREMPDLQALSEQYADQDVAVVGLLYDGDTEEGRGDAADILSDAGVTYQNLLPWDTMASELGVQAFPTTFFVDRNGALVGSVIQGANLQGYVQQLDALLSQ